jgi:hypothetical protein
MFVVVMLSFSAMSPEDQQLFFQLEFLNDGGWIPNPRLLYCSGWKELSNALKSWDDRPTVVLFGPTVTGQPHRLGSFEDYAAARMRIINTTRRVPMATSLPRNWTKRNAKEMNKTTRVPMAVALPSNSANTHSKMCNKRPKLFK